MNDTATPNVWQLLEEPPAWADNISDLYSWSTNYDAGKGPMTLFLDLIGWSDENIGEPLYSLADASLGYMELAKLAAALSQYARHPEAVLAYVDALMEAEARE